MEQRFATSSVGHKCAGMCAYINRENVFSRYMQKEYKHAYRGKDDVIDTYILDATDRKYKRAEDLLNDYECSQFCKRKDASVVRNWDFNLSKQFVVKNKDQTINKEETAKIVKPLINEFLNKNFKNQGYSCIVAIHFSNKENENLHVRFLSLNNNYDQKKHDYISKTYKDENGKTIWRNPLDDKRQSKKAIYEMRKEIATLQNKKLKEMNLNPDVQYKSFKDRNIDKYSHKHMKKKEYDQLLMYLEKHKDIEDVIERNEYISNHYNLTKAQQHYLDVNSFEEIKKPNKKYINTVIKNISNQKQNSSLKDYKGLTRIIRTVTKKVAEETEEVLNEAQNKKRGKSL